MSSGIVQLVAIGAQDEYITGTPEVSFFVSSFKRHTNFSQVVESQVIKGNPSANSMSSIRFDRTGDMLGYTYLTIDNNSEALDIQNWGTLINKVELLIGGQVIDEQDAVFTENIAIDTFATNVSKSALGPHPGISALSYFYPFRFFFCEGTQSALPLVALQYHDVELRIHWGPDAGNYNFECYSNYYYLDNEERKELVDKNHNIIITQVQKNIASNERIQELTFNHPVKYIASSDTSGTGALTSTTNKVKIQINGADITNFKWAKPHFIDVMNYYHTNFVTSPDFFLYCFCIMSSSLQPSGTLNFSRVDSVRIVSQTMNITDPIYAVNYNILRIENGMAGLIYAN
tara:strand:- start:2284 stop:3318 length:1035 start_codon:yes stop_codon:yes gene_type:complete